ncbi:ATP-binding protein [Kitasatospora sp. NPDC094011]|uniref:ATP-binding protein n=1 Tax=Kitasatospora sp. NPDC094011 TaxID=3364090 RepID=UPI0038140DAD
MEPRSCKTTMRFHAGLAQIGVVRRWTKEQLPKLGLRLNEQLVEDIQLAMSELAANAGAP